VTLGSLGGSKDPETIAPAFGDDRRPISQTVRHNDKMDPCSADCAKFIEESAITVAANTGNSLQVETVLRNKTVASVEQTAEQRFATNLTTATFQVRDPGVVLEEFLSTTFDAVSSPAVVTVAKYICNILSNCNDPKYRTINTSNAVFSSRVAGCPLAIEFLFAVGFVQSSQTLHFVFPPEAELHRLERGFSLLSAAFDRLQIPAEDRPRVKVAAVQIVPPITFDLYKPSVIRSAPQVGSYTVPTRCLANDRMAARKEAREVGD
jgi:hypothetical protein